MELFEENVIRNADTQQRQGTFNITPFIRKPRHVFIWALAAAKDSNQEYNIFVFDTYSIPGGRYFTEAQLELNNGIFYPQERLQPTAEIVRVYKTLMKYQMGQINNTITNPTIDLSLFRSLYGLLCFDLRYQELELKSGRTKLDFRYSLNGNPTAAYNLYALVLYEEEITLDAINGIARLRS